MEQAIKNLFANLSEKIDSYKEFLSLLDDEKEAILKNSLQDILDSVKKKNALVRDLERNEEKRKEIIAWFSAKFDLHPAELTLLKLSQLLEEPHAEKLSELRDRLKENIDLVSAMGQRNKNMIAACSASLTQTSNFFQHLTGMQQEYASNGKARDYSTGQGRVFNSRV